MIWPENDLAIAPLGLLEREELEHAEEARRADGGVPAVSGSRLLAKKEV